MSPLMDTGLSPGYFNSHVFQNPLLLCILPLSPLRLNLLSPNDGNSFLLVSLPLVLPSQVHLPNS